MNQDSLKNIWISCHLMYPNVSQARAIFQNLVGATRIENLNFEHLLKNLYIVLNKKSPIKSGFAYFTKFNTQDELWREALNKCALNEIFVMMCVLRYDMKYEQISKIISLPETKVKYLFSQAIKKIIKIPKLEIHQDKNQHLKKYNQQDVSLLFINEHIVDFTLGWVGSDIEEKISSRILNDFQYQEYKARFFNFKNQLQTIHVDEDFNKYLEHIIESQKTNYWARLDFLKSHSTSFVLVVTIIAAFVLILRPNFLLINNLDQKAQKVVLSELMFRRNDISDELNSDSKTEEVKESQNSESAKIAKVENKQEISKTSENSKSDSNAKAKSNVEASLANQTVEKTKTVEAAAKPIAQNKEKPKTNSVLTEQAQKSESGVYRGDLVVNDLDMSSNFLRQKLVELGSKKAGEVELGWSKNVKLKYFHFVFPADKLDAVLELVKSQGELKFSYEKHPRKLEPGQKRFILEVHTQ